MCTATSIYRKKIDTQKVYGGPGGGLGMLTGARDRQAGDGMPEKKLKVGNKNGYNPLFQQSLAHMALQIPGFLPHVAPGAAE